MRAMLLFSGYSAFYAQNDSVLSTSFPGICSWETSAVGVATAQRMHLLCGNDTRSCQTMIMTPPWQCSPRTQSVCAAQAICAGTCLSHCTPWETGKARINITHSIRHTSNMRCALLIRAGMKTARNSSVHLAYEAASPGPQGAEHGWHSVVYPPE